MESCVRDIIKDTMCLTCFAAAIMTLIPVCNTPWIVTKLDAGRADIGAHFSKTPQKNY